MHVIIQIKGIQTMHQKVKSQLFWSEFSTSNSALGFLKEIQDQLKETQNK